MENNIKKSSLKILEKVWPSPWIAEKEGMAHPFSCSLSLMTPPKKKPSLSIPAAALDKLLGKFFKGVDKQNDSILIFQIAYSSYLPLNRPVFLPLKALKSRFSSQASPRLSFIASTSIDSISTRL